MSSRLSSSVRACRFLGPGPASASLPADLPTARLTPVQHAGLIFPPGSTGMLVLGRRDSEWVVGRNGTRVERKVYLQAGATTDELVRTVESFDDGVGEILVAMSSFRPRGALGADYHSWPDKSLPNLLHLRAVWCECDCYKRGDYQHRPSHELVWDILDRCHQSRIPAPSYVVASGRGLHIVWLTEAVPSIALPAWRAVQKRLLSVFSDMGSDENAAAPTGNLRLVGTSNRRLDVRMIWPATVGQIERYTFRALAAEILPYSPEECREYRSKAKERKAARRQPNAVPGASGKRGGGGLTAETYRNAIESDLWKLLDHRYPAGAPVARTEEDDGSHGRFLFAFARLWACRLGADALKAEVEAHAKRLGYRRPADAVREAGTVIRKRRALDARQAGGEARKTFFYRFGPQVLVHDFRIDEATARALDLRILRPLSMIAERAAERQAKARIARGAKPRATAQAERLALGHQAIALREAEGLSRPQLCERLGVKATLLDKAIREAKAKAEAPRVSSRYIEIAPEAVPALEATDAPSYTPFVRDEAPPHEDTRPVTPPEAGGPSHVGMVVKRITPFLTEYRSATEAYDIVRVKVGREWIESRSELPLAPASHVPSRPATEADDAMVIDVLGRVAAEEAEERRRAKRRAKRQA